MSQEEAFEEKAADSTDSEGAGRGKSPSSTEACISYSEFSLENEVFKPFFCGQTVGKYVTFVAAVAVAGRISLRPLPCCII